MNSAPSLPLASSGSIPMRGYGTWSLQNDEGQRVIESALEVGYRHLDTADGYDTHREVGRAIRQSGIARDQLFVTTKVGRDHIGYSDIIDVCHRSLEELQLDYLDLYLVHWPNNDIPMEETFRGMQKLLDEGLIRNCGVSNFTTSRLEKAVAVSSAPIAVNQVEYHPHLNQRELHDCCRRHGIVLAAFSPLVQPKVREDGRLQAIGGHYGKSGAQVILRWLFERGIVAITRGGSRAHQEENFDVLDFELSHFDFDSVDNIADWNRHITWEVGEFDK